MEDIILKPCPFCGSENVNGFSVWTQFELYYVECCDCGATMRRHTDKQKAIDKWNKREPSKE